MLFTFYLGLEICPTFRLSGYKRLSSRGCRISSHNDAPAPPNINIASLPPFLCDKPPRSSENHQRNPQISIRETSAMAGGKGKSGGKSSGGKVGADGSKKQQSHSSKAGLQVSTAQHQIQRRIEFGMRDIWSFLRLCKCQIWMRSILSPAMSRQTT